MTNSILESRLANLTPAKLALLKQNLEKKINEGAKSSTDNSYTSAKKKLSKGDLSDAYAQFQIWEKEFNYNNDTRIDRHLVHKDREENVLISRLQQLQDDYIVGEVFHDLAHAFFYEHPKDHVPGLYILEAARQFGTSLSHLYYNVPFGMSFILDDLQAQFYRFAETSTPLFIVSKISDKVYVDNKLFQMYSNALLVQNEQVIAEVNGTFKIFEMNSYKNIRSGVSRSQSLIKHQ